MNAKVVSLFIALALLISSCKEVGPDINLKNNRNVVSDTTYIESPVAIAETKNVLIEEFTGVRCPNCPQGHIIVANIKAANPGRVVSVSFHPINSLGLPYPFSVHDFRSQKSQSLFDFLGQIGLEPASGIDRKKFSGESNILLDKNKWNTYVNEQLALTTPVNLLLSADYDTASRQLTIVAELHYTQNVSEENKLTLMLTENDLITAQLDGAIVDTFYNHNDIMREIISDTQGDVISVPTDAGRVIRKVYRTVLDASWKPENMHILAYVHEYQNGKTVYQAKEIRVQ